MSSIPATSIETGSAPESLHELIRARWSPRAYLDRPIEPDKLRTLFQAAQWAQSCFNEQPWRFMLATKADPQKFEQMIGILVERNQQWAKTAYAIGFSVGKKTFTHNGLPDRFGLHDAGAAAQNLAIEAVDLGLHAHFMGGFDPVRARELFHVPEDFEIGAAFAIGYVDEETVKPPARTRKPLEEIVFAGDWGSPAEL